MGGFPTLCSNGCGFFSSVDSKGLCSVCYKEEQKKNAPPTQSSSTTTTTTSTSTNTSKSDLHQPTTLSENSNVELESKSEASSIAVAQTPSTSAHATEEEKDDPVPAKKLKKNRCLTCKKKLGLTGFTCRCGDLFCSIHRYSDKHDCTFDYNAMGRRRLEITTLLLWRRRWP